MHSFSLRDVQAVATGKRDLRDSLPLLELLERHLIAAGCILVESIRGHCRLVLDTAQEIGSRVKAFVNRQSGHVLPQGNIPWSQVSPLLSDKDIAILILKIREVLRNDSD